MFRPIPVERLIFGAGEHRIVCGDALSCPALDEYAGKAQAVYADPPFMTGDQLDGKRPFGEDGWRSGKPTVALPGFSDRFASRDAYLDLLRGLVNRARDLLTDTGLFMLHLDWRVSAHARLICDEIFGEKCFVNEVIWAYESGGRSTRTFSRKHDTILIYGRTADWRLEPLAAGIPRSQFRRRNHMKRMVDERGRVYSVMVSNGKEYRYYDDDLISPSDVWTDISHLQQLDPERTGWPTQKPLRLLRRLLACALKPGETAVELCCGSGTACAAAQALGGHYVGIDLSREALVTAALRMELKGFTLRMPVGETKAKLEGSVDENGLLLLNAFCTPDIDPEACEKPLDAMEAWLCGRITGDGFVAEERFRRTARHPALAPMALARPGDGEPAVVCFDAAGQAHAYVWRNDEN